MKAKVCAVCGAEFTPASGNQKYCLECREEARKAKAREFQHRYYKENAEKRRENSRRYRRENREKVLEYQRNYYKANHEKILENASEFRKANRESMREQGRKYYAENREKCREYGRRYRLAHLEDFRERQRKLREKRRLEKTETRKCPFCGKEFDTWDKRRMYCSTECRAEAKLVRDRMRYEKVEKAQPKQEIQPKRKQKPPRAKGKPVGCGFKGSCLECPYPECVEV